MVSEQQRRHQDTHLERQRPDHPDSAASLLLLPRLQQITLHQASHRSRPLQRLQDLLKEHPPLRRLETERTCLEEHLLAPVERKSFSFLGTAANFAYHLNDSKMGRLGSILARHCDVKEGF